jgi:hypothetical protein
MGQFLTHVTTSHERWDLISWFYYGDATLYQYILAANPAVPIVSELAAGIVLRVPVLQVAAPEVTPLPPWRRG